MILTDRGKQHLRPVADWDCFHIGSSIVNSDRNLWTRHTSSTSKLTGRPPDNTQSY